MAYRDTFLAYKSCVGQKYHVLFAAESAARSAASSAVNCGADEVCRLVRHFASEMQDGKLGLVFLNLKSRVVSRRK